MVADPGRFPWPCATAVPVAVKPNNITSIPAAIAARHRNSTSRLVPVCTYQTSYRPEPYRTLRRFQDLRYIAWTRPGLFDCARIGLAHRSASSVTFALNSPVNRFVSSSRIPPSVGGIHLSNLSDFLGPPHPRQGGNGLGPRTVAARWVKNAAGRLHHMPRLSPLLSDKQRGTRPKVATRRLAQSPRGLQALATAGLSEHRRCLAVIPFPTPKALRISHPTHRGACRALSSSGCAPLPSSSPSPPGSPMEKACSFRNTGV